jgi:hypothetical protein
LNVHEEDLRSHEKDNTESVAVDEIPNIPDEAWSKDVLGNTFY